MSTRRARFARFSPETVLSRTHAIDHATQHFDSGAFLADLNRRVGVHTESQEADRAAVLHAYLSDEIVPAAVEIPASRGEDGRLRCVTRLSAMISL